MALNMKWTLTLLCVLNCFISDGVLCDDFSDFISPEDEKFFQSMGALNATSTTPEGEWIGNRYWPADDDDDAGIYLENKFGGSSERAAQVDCFGLGSFAERVRWMFNMRPQSSQEVNVQFYFSSRRQRNRVQVLSGDQFGLDWVDFNPNRTTVIIVHGFMSHSNASWVRRMADSFLDWGDVNVIAIDWSTGGNTWKYWRAVANTRTVGTDITAFLRQLMNATGCLTRDFHFVGHSLGAHICSYAASHLGGVKRITGLDPAQPCFETRDTAMLLDPSDADFVDVIHTNGRWLSKIGLGMPDPSGHADFYPNGGMQQPGCTNSSQSFLSRILPFTPNDMLAAVCSHGRSYVLFTESLVSQNCIFEAHRWNMSYFGVNASLARPCDTKGSCALMGIGSIGGGGLARAGGTYYVMTADIAPFCPTEPGRGIIPSRLFLADLLKGFRLDRRQELTDEVEPIEETVNTKNVARVAADPLREVVIETVVTTTPKSWWKFWK